MRLFFALQLPGRPESLLGGSQRIGAGAGLQREAGAHQQAIYPSGDHQWGSLAHSAPAVEVVHGLLRV